MTIVLCALYDYGMSEASGGRDYSAAVGRARRPTRRRVAVRVAEGAAALGVAGGLAFSIAKGLHDEQPSLTARIDYNAANKLNEQRQEVHHGIYLTLIIV